MFQDGGLTYAEAIQRKAYLGHRARKNEKPGSPEARNWCSGLQTLAGIGRGSELKGEM